MKGVLIIAHGSRRKETLKTMEYITDLTREMVRGTEVVAAYMEFAPPNVIEGLEELKTKGITDILVVPYFLFEGIHIKEDIPKELEKFKQLNPSITVNMTSTLGEDKRLAEILSEKIKEAF